MYICSFLVNAVPIYHYSMFYYFRPVSCTATKFALYLHSNVAKWFLQHTVLVYKSVITDIMPHFLFDILVSKLVNVFLENHVE